MGAGASERSSVSFDCGHFDRAEGPPSSGQASVPGSQSNLKLSGANLGL